MTHTKHPVWKMALPLFLILTAGYAFGQDAGSFRTASFDPRALAAARRTIAYATDGSLAGELQWLSVQTACLAIYNMAQTGDFTLEDPYDYYQPGAIREYLTSLSGDETQNIMTYGICFNYAQLAYNDISRYRGHYEKLGMRTNSWYIAAVFENPGQIILFDPVSRDRATMTVNGVSVRENSRQNVRTHGGATYHAWLWVYGNDGTIYWIDPTWTDNAGYVVWGVVRNGAEVPVRPRQDLCMAPVSSNDASYEAAGRGDASKNRGDWDRAIADYTAALREDPNNVRAYYGRGNAFRSKGDHDTAIADYTQAIRLDPNYTFAYYARGITYRAKGDNDRAIADHTQAIRLDSNYVRAYYGRGLAYYYKKDYDRAIADYTQAIRLDPNYAIAYYGRGLAYRGKGDNDTAIADYTQAIRLDPNDVDAYYGRGLAYRGKGDNDRAIADYTQAIRLDPGYVIAYVGRGNAYRDKGDNDRAIADHTQAIRLDPNYVIAYVGRGNAYRDKGDNDRAIADHTQAIALEPTASRYTNRGLAYRGKGDPDRAIADYTQAIRLDPNYATAYYNRGGAYYAKRDYNRAIADYEAVLRINPNHANAKTGLENARKARGY
jgi:tetratricopeptide (TPR) repeat protein